MSTFIHFNKPLTGQEIANHVVSYAHQNKINHVQSESVPNKDLYQESTGVFLGYQTRQHGDILIKHSEGYKFNLNTSYKSICLFNGHWEKPTQLTPRQKRTRYQYLTNLTKSLEEIINTTATN